MIARFGPMGRYEAKPENGEATSIVGDPNNAWSDGSNESYATIQYGGFEDPWGHPYAQILDLPMSPQQASVVQEVLVTWTARVVEFDPSAPAYYREQMAVSPRIRIAIGEEGFAGPGYYSLATAAWDGDNADSLYAEVNPNSPWEELYLPADGSWKTFTERYIPIYAGNATVQQILSQDLSESGYFTLEELLAAGAFSAGGYPNMYVTIFQDSFWSEDKFAVSEISINIVTPLGVINAGGSAARARFT